MMTRMTLSGHLLPGDSFRIGSVIWTVKRKEVLPYSEQVELTVWSEFEEDVTIFVNMGMMVEVE